MGDKCDHRKCRFQKRRSTTAQKALRESTDKQAEVDLLIRSNPESATPTSMGCIFRVSFEAWGCKMAKGVALVCLPAFFDTGCGPIGAQQQL